MSDEDKKLLLARAPCPAWADYEHCFEVLYRSCEGRRTIEPQPEGKFSGIIAKRCLCGAEVSRVSTTAEDARRLP
jgi:hypothetical protein